MFGKCYGRPESFSARADAPDVPCGVKSDDYIFNKIYDELFANRVHKDQHEDNHYYNQLVPDYFNECGKANLIEKLNRYFDECVKVASMDRDKFIDSVCELFERDKKGFENWRTREVFDLLQALPEKTIRGYLDLKES